MGWTLYYGCVQTDLMADYCLTEAVIMAYLYINHGWKGMDLAHAELIALMFDH